MRVEYINPFVEAAFNVMSEVLNVEIKRGELYLKSISQPVLGVTAIVGLAGDVEGRVLFDMAEDTALGIASQMNGEQLTTQAITKLHDLGFQFDLTPPAIFTGDNMQVTDTEIEALIVPIEMKFGKIEINVAVREKN
jgi:chemotaxis protein CheX